MKIFSLLQVKYQQFEGAVKSYLSKTLSSYGVAYGNNTIFGQLINVINNVVQNIMLYIEDSLTEQTHLLMSPHLNGSGRLFGGQLLAWIDETAGLVGRRHAGTDIVTAAIIIVALK